MDQCSATNEHTREAERYSSLFQHLIMGNKQTSREKWEVV